MSDNLLTLLLKPPHVLQQTDQLFERLQDQHQVLLCDVTAAVGFSARHRQDEGGEEVEVGLVDCVEEIELQIVASRFPRFSYQLNLFVCERRL